MNDDEIKIIVLSDIHGKTKIAEKILTTNDYNYSVVAGDFVCDDSFINEWFDFAVRGNNDWDSNLKDELSFEIEGFKFYLCHGHLVGTYFQLDNYEFMHKILKRTKCDIFIHGHTHVPKIFEYDEGFVINPGSTSLPRGGSKASYAIITINKKQRSVQCKIIEIE